MVPTEEQLSEESLDYQLFYKTAKELLSKTFSEREIDQILNYKTIYLPASLYKRLCDWRKKHSVEELYEA